jgi:hypothetical protein
MAFRIVGGAPIVPASPMPASDDSAGLPQYVETVIKAIADRTDLVLVAQSLAGFTAPLVCTRVPVRLLVLVNAMISEPGGTPGEWWGNTGQADAKRANDGREGRSPDAEFDLATDFFHDVPSYLRRVAQERLGITPDEMPGGHLVALSRPKEVAERLAAYAAELQDA